MSADAWEFCPICSKEIEEIENRIKEGYGKLDYSEFIKLTNKLKDKKRN